MRLSEKGQSIWSAGERRRAFAGLVEFLKFPELGAGVLQAAVELGRFENMQKAEETDAYDDFRLRTTDSDDPESRKVRRGKAGGYVDYMSAADIDYCDRLIAEQLDPAYACYGAE